MAPLPYVIGGSGPIQDLNHALTYSIGTRGITPHIASSMNNLGLTRLIVTPVHDYGRCFYIFFITSIGCHGISADKPWSQ
jgi:hypothetical protein